MSDYRKVNRKLEKLECMLHGMSDFDKSDWKKIWKQIEVTGKSFKGGRFPSKDEHEAAWNRFRQSVDKVKAQQAKNRKLWKKKKKESSRLRKMILSQAEAARPVDSGLADFTLILADGRDSMLLDAVMGPFDEEKERLKSCSGQLQKGWDMLHENKKNMLGKDKRMTFKVLKEIRELLDRHRKTYKAERQKAYEEYQRERTRKQHAWEQKIEANIGKLEKRRNKLHIVLGNKERYLDELHGKLRDTRSDDFRSVVSGWISEEEGGIREVKEKLGRIDGWIYEDKENLR